MNLYIDPRIASITSIDSLQVFFEEIEAIEGYKMIKDIEEVRNVYDPVRDFVSYYSSTLPKQIENPNFDSTQEESNSNPRYLNIQLDEATITYITQRLYAAKGYPEIFNIMKELLSNEYSRFDIEASFQGSFLSTIHITEIKTLQIDNIMTKLLTALFYLILLEEVQILIDHLIMDILLESNKITSINSQAYNIVNVEVVD